MASATRTRCSWRACARSRAKGATHPLPEPPDPTLYKQKPKKKKGKKGKKGAADVWTGQPPKEPKTEL